MAANRESITNLIRHRRTIKPKDYSGETVSDDIIREILENANWAPTHGMTQPWRFHVFSGPARETLGVFLSETYQSICPPEQFKPKKFDSMRVNPTLASAVIAVGMKRQEIEKITELDELLAVGCAVQNMHLTAAAHGIGGFWSTNIAATSAAMRTRIGLGEKDRALGLFYLGYPSTDWPTSERQSIDQLVHWETASSD